MQFSTGDHARHRRSGRIRILDDAIPRGRRYPSGYRQALVAGGPDPAPHSSRLILEGTRDGGLGVVLDLPQVLLAAKTLRIDLVDILGARRPRGKPSVIGRDLDAAERLTVAGSGREDRANRLAGKFRHRELFRRKRLQPVLLRGCGGGLYACCKRARPPPPPG